MISPIIVHGPAAYTEIANSEILSNMQVDAGDFSHFEDSLANSNYSYRELSIMKSDNAVEREQTNPSQKKEGPRT